MTMLHSRLWLALPIVAIALSSAACSSTSTCSRDADWVTVDRKEGIVEGKTYRSSNYGGPYQFFPPARTISFEHGLDAVPYAIQFWVAFTKDGTLAPAAGNMTELRSFDNDTEPPLDDQRIAVRNDTCTEFYLWVVATAPCPCLPISSAGDAIVAKQPPLRRELVTKKY